MQLFTKKGLMYLRPFCYFWRRGRDSNPRYGVTVHTLSRRAPSATRTPLQIKIVNSFSKQLPQSHAMCSLFGDYVTSPLRGRRRFAPTLSRLRLGSATRTPLQILIRKSFSIQLPQSHAMCSLFAYIRPTPHRTLRVHYGYLILRIEATRSPLQIPENTR